MLDLLARFGGKIGIAIDIGVSLTVIGGIIAFLITRHEEDKRLKRHRSWDAFESYTQLILIGILKKRDNYLDVYSEFLRNSPGGLQNLEFTGNGVNRLISEVQSSINYVKASVERGFKDFESTDDNVKKRALYYLELCLGLYSDLSSWSRSAVAFVDAVKAAEGKEASVLASYKGEAQELLIHPAYLITDFYRKVVAEFEYVKG